MVEPTIENFKYTCPQCGEHHIKVAIDGSAQTSTIVKMTITHHPGYGSQTGFFGQKAYDEVDFEEENPIEGNWLKFSCADCSRPLLNKRGHPLNYVSRKSLLTATSFVRKVEDNG